MSEKTKPYSRGPKVLKMLYDYGPLNRPAISELSVPKMSKRSASFCISRLEKRGLILQGNYNKISKQTDAFFHLAYGEKAKTDLSGILGIEKEKLKLTQYRGHDVDHSILCAYWAEYFKRSIKGASVLRDMHIPSNSEILTKLLLGRELEFYPDIVVHKKNAGNSGGTTVAIEVEKTPKLRGRVFRKLDKFATKSNVDGIIYACPKHTLNDFIGSIYGKRIQQASRRTRKYGDSFLMFANSLAPSIDGVMLHNLSGKTISLKDWFQTLDQTLWSDRTDADFKHVTHLGNMFEESEIYGLQEKMKLN